MKELGGALLKTLGNVAIRGLGDEVDRRIKQKEYEKRIEKIGKEIAGIEGLEDVGELMQSGGIKSFDEMRQLMDLKKASAETPMGVEEFETKILGKDKQEMLDYLQSDVVDKWLNDKNIPIENMPTAPKNRLEKLRAAGFEPSISAGKLDIIPVSEFEKRFGLEKEKFEESKEQFEKEQALKEKRFNLDERLSKVLAKKYESQINQIDNDIEATKEKLRLAAESAASQQELQKYKLAIDRLRAEKELRKADFDMKMETIKLGYQTAPRGVFFGPTTKSIEEQTAKLSKKLRGTSGVGETKVINGATYRKEADGKWYLQE